MRRQDHAQQPLLRRLIRRLPEPRMEPTARVQLIDVELSGPMGPLGGIESPVARILVTAHGQALGMIDLPCPDGTISRSVLRQAINFELGPACADHLRRDGLRAFDDATGSATPQCLLDLEPPRPAPLVTVVIPTRNRSAQLAVCLASLHNLAYPNFEVIVVDNAPSDGSTREIVSHATSVDARIRYLHEPLPGASRARNLGMTAGTGEFVAFTDDDVVVDRLWLNGLVAGFGEDPNVEIVGGLTIAGQLDTPAQHAFELYGGMARGYRHRAYDLDRNRGDTLLYPYTPGIFGASNNVAFRRRAFMDGGGFDLAFGPATPAYSAEDLDAFLSTILDGRQIIYEPRAMVRHEHRRSFSELYWQVFTYSAGSSALLTKWSLARPSVAWELAHRLPRILPAALLHKHRGGPAAGVGAYPLQIRWLERAGYLYGPIAYFRALSWAKGQERRTPSIDAGQLTPAT